MAAAALPSHPEPDQSGILAALRQKVLTTMAQTAAKAKRKSPPSSKLTRLRTKLEQSHSCSVEEAIAKERAEAEAQAALTESSESAA